MYKACFHAPALLIHVSMHQTVCPDPTFLVTKQHLPQTTHTFFLAGLNAKAVLKI